MLAALGILLGLGFWQLERLQWKRAVLAAIARAEQAPAVPLGVAPLPNYAKVVAEGMLRPDLGVLYGAQVRDTAGGARLGARLIAPLERAGAEPLLVDVGWVPFDWHPAGPPVATRIEGYVRPPDRRGWFSAADDPAKRHFYTLDPAAIGAAIGLKRPAPFIVVALGSTAASGAADPARTLPRPPNDHLSYAITWFGLAAGLVAVFVLWSRKVLRT